MGLKENLYYDRDSISYPVVYRQKKNNINTKKTNEITEQIRNRNSKAHKRNINRQNDRLKKYSNYIDDDEIIQLKNIDKKPGKTSPNGIETSSIDILYNEKNINNLTPKKINTPMKKKIPVTKYITPVKTEINGKYITPSKMPRQTTGNEDTPTKSPFSETLPDGILISSPVCITPLKSTIPLNSSSSSLSSYNNITNITNNNHNTITITSSISTLSITSPSSNNLNISNITTPSQKKLNTLSPPSSSTSPPQSTPQLAPDVVSRAIFHALFGSLNKSMSSSLPWDDDDEDEDCDDVVCDDLYQCKSVEPVDELWFTRLMSTSLLTTQALNYALHTTGTTTATSFFQQQVNRGNPILTQDDLLSNYINPSFITSLISQLPYEDERFTSPRLSVLKAIYKTVPKFRSLIAYSLLSVSNQRFMRCKTSSKLAVMYELDINHTGTKIGDMYSYSIPEHVDINSAYSCFPVDDIPYPPNQKSKLPNQPPLIAQTSSTQYSTTSNNTASTPTINIRDHDQSIIELALYMIITTEQEDDDEELESNFDEQDLQKDQDKEQLNDEKHNLLNSKPSLSRLFLSTVINVLRCYGRRLGKTTEGVEQPNILKSCLRAFEEMIVRVKDDSIEKVIIPAILHSWPGGGNSIREAAFLKALGVVLPHCRPYFIINPFITNNSNSSLSSSTSTSTSLSILTKSLSLPPSTALYKTLTRVILCINSIHFKVCQESMNLISNEKILSHYLYDSEECRHLLDTLVNALRQNRNHWNISVKQTSERCLDQIYESME